jgi:hypothetical protein
MTGHRRCSRYDLVNDGVQKPTSVAEQTALQRLLPLKVATWTHALWLIAVITRRCVQFAPVTR